MRLLSTVFLILVCCGAMRPVSAQTIPYVSIPCASCTTQAQLTTAATVYLKQYAQATPATAPGYVGVIGLPKYLTGSCGAGQLGATTVVVASTSIVGTFYGCYGQQKSTPMTAVPLQSSTDPCYVAKNLVPVPCVTLTNNVNFKGTPTPGAPLPAFTPLSWGTTSAQIQANFPANIEYDLQNNQNLNQAVTAMQPAMVARLSTELATLDHSGYTPLILAYAAEKLSAVNLRVLQSAFGPTLVANALGYAPLAVQTAYNALPVSAPLFGSQYYISLGNAAPPPDSAYIYDVFLDQYLSTNDSPTVAEHKMNLYLQVRMHATVERIIGLVAGVFGIANFFDITWDQINSNMTYYQNIALDRLSVINVPNPTIEMPQPVDPGMLTFPPIDNPPDDTAFCDDPDGCKF